MQCKVIIVSFVLFMNFIINGKYVIIINYTQYY